jgi:excisionase family DNA binding protein
MNETLLTVKDVAQHFDVSTVTVYSWIRSGKLKSIIVGNRKVRIQPCDLPDDPPSGKPQ